MKLVGYAAFLAALAMAGAACAGGNLIANGDFSVGPAGGPKDFTTDYDFIANPGSSSLTTEGTETITTNPVLVHPYWVDLGAASNPMLVVNGATEGSPIIWQESDIVAAVGGTYNFSAKVMDICCNETYGANSNAPSQIVFQVSLDGGATWDPLASYTTKPTVPAPGKDAGFFVTVAGHFIAAPGGKFSIRALNGYSAAGGNDFGLDDISVSSTPEPATWALMVIGLGGLGAVVRRRRGLLAA